MIFLIRFLLSTIISSIIYPVTMLHAGRSLPEIQKMRHQKAYGLQKPQLTKTQRMAKHKLTRPKHWENLQNSYDEGLRIAKARIKMTEEESISHLEQAYRNYPSTPREVLDLTQCD